MSLKLYFSPGACSFVPHCLLEASGAAYESVMVKLHKGEQNSDAYKALNPRGQVPVLVHDGQVITQIIAIADYLAGLFPQQQFLPAALGERARVLSTFAWMNNTVHPGFTHIFMPHKFTDDAQAQAAIKRYGVTLYRGYLGEIEALVQAASARGDAWLGGAQFGPLDPYALTLARWGTLAGIPPADHPALWSFVEGKVARHPPVARVIERERLQLNMIKPAN